MEFEFELDDLVVEEPQGIPDVVLNIIRDKETHGIISDASVSKLIFSGTGARYILDKEKQRGQKADINFRAKFRCEPDDEWEELIYGRLNMGKLEKSCGSECTVTISVEATGCTMIIANLYDQKVDLDSLIGFDGFTALQKYAKIGVEIPMPAKRLQVAVEGYVADNDGAGDVVDLEIFTNTTKYFSVRATYADTKNESINESLLNPTVFAASDNGVNDSVISPILLLNDDIKCISGNFKYAKRLKGSYDFRWVGIVSTIEYVRLRVAVGEYPNSLTILHEQNLPFGEGDDDAAVGTFDYSYSGTTNIENGKGFYAYLEASYSGVPGGFTGHVTFDKETYVNITAEKECPATTAKVYPINESLSHIVEAITNNCLRVRSDYYGRTDSQPYAAEADGCGSLRAINSGLQLRKADDAKCFVSLKDAFEGLNPIDNIGYGFEDDPDRPGFQQLRVESVEHFYRDEEILFCPFVDKALITIDESRHYSTIKIGYEKWEVESVNGLNEIHSDRQYRTSLSSINTTLDKTSKLVAGSFPIEVTRQQSFAETGKADTKYDNDIFIYCLKRSGGGLAIEQGGAKNVTGLFSPETIFNWRIRPLANLMRWFKSIAPSYSNLTDTDSKLYFTSGTGNYTAAGEQVDEVCKIEKGVKAENTDLSASDFADSSEPIPLWEAKPIKFTYPLSVSDYNRIKQNPYGYITVQCGTGDILKGYIDNVQYNPIKGQANFILRKKWE